MGKFRLSNMIPNAWFFKLNTTKNNHNRSSPKKKKSCPSPTLVAAAPAAPFSSPTSTHKESSNNHQETLPTNSSRKSYHFTRQLAYQQNGGKSPEKESLSRVSVESPRISTRKRRSHHSSSKRRTSTTSCSSTNSTATKYYSSSTAGCSCGGAVKPDSSTTTTSDPNSTLQSSINSPYHNHLLLASTGEAKLCFDRVTAWSSSSPPNTTACDCDCDVGVGGRNDIVIQVDEKSMSLSSKNKTGDVLWSSGGGDGGGDGVGGVLALGSGLPPIKTDKNNNNIRKLNGADHHMVGGGGEKVKGGRKSYGKSREKKWNLSSVKLAAAVEEESVASSPATIPHRKFPVAGTPGGGVRLRINSPRIGRRTTTQGGRKSVSNSSSSSSNSIVRRRKSISAESLAIVKSSSDPQRDFRDSMVEMIVENKIKSSKDLEELLACYLSLNADEYHEVIIKVFKQLWFDLNMAKINANANDN